MFNSIAFGGGGVRGGLHVGGLAAIESLRGDLVFPDGVYGSSVGAIVATAIAFRLNAIQIKQMFDDYFSLDRFLPPLRLANVARLPDTKGFFTMDLLADMLVTAFRSQNVDLKDKTIADAPQKLYILASNMTTRKVNLLTGDIPVLDAIKCSCCLPFVFEPQILHNQVYMDGGLIADSLDTYVPPDCLVFHISASGDSLFPSELASMPMAVFAHSIYRTLRATPRSPNVVWLQNDTVNMLQEITSDDKKRMFDQGYSQTTRFWSKRFAEKLE
jgi:hypothetical protein